MWKTKKSFLLKIAFTFLGHLNSIFLSGKWSLSLLACTNAFVELIDMIALFLFFPGSFFCLRTSFSLTMLPWRFWVSLRAVIFFYLWSCETWLNYWCLCLPLCSTARSQSLVIKTSCWLWNGKMSNNNVQLFNLFILLHFCLGNQNGNFEFW